MNNTQYTIQRIYNKRSTGFIYLYLNFTYCLLFVHLIADIQQVNMMMGELICKLHKVFIYYALNA